MKYTAPSPKQFEAVDTLMEVLSSFYNVYQHEISDTTQRTSITGNARAVAAVIMIDHISLNRIQAARLLLGNDKIQSLDQMQRRGRMVRQLVRDTQLVLSELNFLLKQVTEEPCKN